MERALSPEEKIRRAEEIYQKRKEQNYTTNQARVNVNKPSKDYGLFRKLVLQIIICLLIYLIFYLIKNSNYIFSEEFLKKSKEILSYDINSSQKYVEFVDWINSKSKEKTQENTINETISPDLDNQTDNQIMEEGQTQTQNTLLEGNSQTLSVAEDSSSISQTAIDAEEIKAKYSLIKPLEGTITSRFGVRNPTTETVPKYHTGIDIAANTGTVFVASMEGTVVQVSSEGDFRKPSENSKGRCYYSICTLQ